MERSFSSFSRSCSIALLFAFCTACSSTAPTELATPTTDAPRIIQPGAPGQPSREVDQAILEADPRPPYTAADVAFMQGMIHHHAQAPGDDSFSQRSDE